MTNQSEFPNALSAGQFEDLYPNDDACVADLLLRRWPDGFVCPACGSRNAVRLKRKRCVHQCRDCRKQTSVTAGTFMRRSHVPLKSWYRAVYIPRGDGGRRRVPAGRECAGGRDVNAKVKFPSNCISRSSKFGWNRGGSGLLRVRAGFASSRLRRVQFARFQR